MTATSHPIPAVCPELGIEVPVAAIDGELRKLWEQDEARTNASLMNLVVYSEKPGALIENSVIIRDLTREHACRAILVGVDRNEPTPSIRAWITAHCHLSDGRKSICCEQIAIQLTGRVTGRFRNTVFAHLNSDLPLVFWWQGELSDILTERLVAVIDRLIIDSSSWADPAASFDRIQAAAQANEALIIQDHAWTRTWQFRLGIASLFDDPAAQQALPDIQEVEIRYHPDHRMSALQVLAWITVQADWKKTANPLIYQSPKGINISVSLIEESGGPPLTCVVFRSGATTVSVSQKPRSSHVERRVDSPCYHATSLSPVDPTRPPELVATQLARGGKNSLYQKILPEFREMLEAEKNR
jgi:glucose-6-phosphate dehydrogenase assembly protein OpcA